MPKRAFPSTFHPHGERVSPLLNFFVLHQRFRQTARLQYGAGLRLSELVRLRIQDVDENRGIVTVRCAKGDKDRTTVLPEALRVEVAEKKAELRQLFEEDRASGLAGCWLPEALARKHPHGGG